MGGPKWLWGACAVGVVTAIALPAHADEGHFDRKVPADPHGVVEISNVSGSVDVTGWDSPQVEVTADYGGGVERVDLTSEQGRTSVKVVVPNRSSFRSGEADLHIKVPRGSELEVSAVSADLNLHNIHGAQSLKTVSGGIQTEAFEGDVEIKTVSGDATLVGHDQSATIHVTTVSGTVKVEHGAGDLEATSISGDMTVQLVPGHTVRLRTTSGDLQLNGKLTRDGSVEAESVSGDVRLRLSGESGYQYELATFRGDIDNCFGVNAEPASKYGAGSRLNGTRGEGKGRVRLHTMSGDIALCDRP